MSKHNSPASLFSAVFAESFMAIPFDPKWSNKIGHFPNAVEGEHAAKIAPGKLLKSTTPGGRRLMLLGTRLGNVVIYERFSKGENNGVQVICMHCTPKFQLGQWAQPGALDLYDLENLIDLKGGLHIGRVIEDLYCTLTQPTS